MRNYITIVERELKQSSSNSPFVSEMRSIATHLASLGFKFNREWSNKIPTQVKQLQNEYEKDDRSFSAINEYPKVIETFWRENISYMFKSLHHEVIQMMQNHHARNENSYDPDSAFIKCMHAQVDVADWLIEQDNIVNEQFMTQFYKHMQALFETCDKPDFAKSFVSDMEKIIPFILLAASLVR